MITGLSSCASQVPGVIVRKGAEESSAYDDFSPVVLKQAAYIYIYIIHIYIYMYIYVCVYI